MKRNLVVLVSGLLLIAALGACRKEGGASAPGTGKVYLLNFKTEIQRQWEEVAAQFTAETGIPMKVVTAGSGNYEQTLRSEVSKSEPPTLFNINGPVGYLTWKDFCRNIKDTDIYNWLLDKSMAISSGDGVYGIPYAVETYGILYNDAIMRKYFALPDKKVSISSAKEINNFALLKAVVEDMTAHKAQLGIGGVFASTSFSPGEDWRWQTHLANIPIYYEYKAKGVGDLDKIEFTYSKNYQNIFDLYLNNSVTDRKMVGAKTVGDSMAEFALGKAAMVQNGKWAWSQIEAEAGNMVKPEDIKFLPIYTGVSGEEKQGLCTGTENFICVNAKAPQADQEASIKLLEWLFSSDTGRKNTIEKLEFIAPFSTFDKSERPSNPLALEMFAYMDNQELSSVSWNFPTFPSQEFKNELGAALYDYAIGNSSWEDVTRITIETWAAEKAAIQ